MRPIWILILATLTASAQTDKPKLAITGETGITFSAAILPLESAIVKESTDKDGYHYVIDSPDKSFHCYLVSRVDERPGNVYDKGLAAFTVACVKAKLEHPNG